MASPTGLEHWIASAGNLKFFILALAALVLASGSLFYAWTNFVRKRVMQDMPTAKLRSAAQGYVELQGQAELMDGAAIYAPLSREICVWYRYKVERRDNSPSNRSQDTRWRTAESGTSDELFYLVDDTGRCAVDPEGAKVSTRHKRIWYGKNRAAPKYTEENLWWQISGLSRMGKQYRFTEERILPGDPLYALGNFTTHGGAGVSFDLKSEVGEILRDWKRNTEKLLADFDTDNDGEISMQEWSAARRAAEQQALQSRQHQAVAPPVDVLARGTNRRNPFIIATYTEDEMLNKFHWMFVGGFIFGGLLFLGASWAIIIRLSH